MDLSIRVIDGDWARQISHKEKAIPGTSTHTLLDQKLDKLFKDGEVSLQDVREVEIDLRDRKIRVYLSDSTHVSLGEEKEDLDPLFSHFIEYHKGSDKAQFRQLFPHMDEASLNQLSDFTTFKLLYEPFGKREDEALLIGRLCAFQEKLNPVALEHALQSFSNGDETRRKRTLELFVALLTEYGPVLDQHAPNGDDGDLYLMWIASQIAGKMDLSEEQVVGLAKLGFNPDQILDMTPEKANTAIASQIPLPKYEGRENVLEGYFKAISESPESPNKCQAMALASVASPRMEAAMSKKEFSSAPDWESFVARRKDIGTFYQSDQSQYGTLMSNLTHDLSNSIKQGDTDVENLLSRAAMGRRAIGYFFDRPDPEKIGRLRRPDEDLVTRVTDDSLYSKLGDRLLMSFETSLRDIASHDKEVGSWIDWETGTLFLAKEMKIFHANPEKANLIMQLVKTEVYPKMLAETDPERLVELAGEAFWLICQAKPWSLGDPSIAEVFVRSILLSKGVDLGMWKQGIVPWEEASVARDDVSFGKIFPTLFERPPEGNPPSTLYI